jgi:hypothetical protein
MITLIYLIGIIIIIIIIIIISGSSSSIRIIWIGFFCVSFIFCTRAHFVIGFLPVTLHVHEQALNWTEFNYHC